MFDKKKHLQLLLNLGEIGGKGKKNMPTQGEVIKELSEKLERQLIIDDLTKIQTMEELKVYIEKLRAKNE